ncbi:hypothetical protein GCM10022380_33120 [Amycolatopsis tucumanensis]|uniref:Uncharacterized protein n=1 Tax=Amycolatopsis tucumanensis TaxID=401106 RepID=A0ABP7I986_9PSEU
MGSSVAGLIGGQTPVSFCALTVKNIANSPAKNMSSLESHTIVPTLTMFGRFSECTRWLMVGAAVVTGRIMSPCEATCLVGSGTPRRGCWSQ